MESPIRCFSRTVAREVVVDGIVLPAGARVVLHYASANRDEPYWTRPDEFDIHRPQAGTHLGFGRELTIALVRGWLGSKATR